MNEPVIACPHCHHPVADENAASKFTFFCAHCGKSFNIDEARAGALAWPAVDKAAIIAKVNRQTHIICGVLALVAVTVIAFGYRQCSKWLGKAEANTCYDSGMAFVMSQNFVKKRLKSPASAQFPYKADVAEYKGDCTHTIMSHVDSQNGFGAMLRTRYVAEMKYTGDGMWQMKNLEFIE